MPKLLFSFATLFSLTTYACQSTPPSAQGDHEGGPLDATADVPLEASSSPDATDNDAEASPPVDASEAAAAPPSGDAYDENISAPADANDGSTEATASVTVRIENDGGTIRVGADVLAITVDPLALTPTFSPFTNDYYIRCAAGDNTITLSVTYASGMQTVPLNVAEDQAIVVQDRYWIRCLPHDFPDITVTKQGSGPTPGYYLANSKTFAVVFDTNGTPLWYERGSLVLNVDAPAVDTISLMPNGTGPFGTSLSSQFDIHALDTSSIASVIAVGGPTDAHELRTLSNGDHLLFVYPIEQGVDLTGLQSFGAGQTVADCEIQEVDAAGNLVWSWLASNHVDPVKESLEPAASSVSDAGTVIDIFHCNSVDVDSTGNLLLSMRHANALYYIDRTSGRIQWKLGGTSYNKDGATTIAVQTDPETSFSMQHDARLLTDGHVTMFDNHGGSAGVARGVEYAVDHMANVATVAWQYLGTAQSQYEGSFRRYLDGESVIGWGYIPSDQRIVTEVDANGNDVFDIALSGTNQSYRAVKVPLSQLSINMLRATAGK